MIPLLAAAGIAGGASLLSGLATSAFNAFEQSKNRETQIDLANTSHQREVADLRAAGLNPILSANGGAPTPNLQAPQVDNPVPGALSSALAAAQIKSSIDLQNAQALAAESSAQSTNMDFQLKQNAMTNTLEQQRLAILNSSMDLKTKKSQLETIEQQIERNKLQNLGLRYELPGLYNEAQFQKSDVGKKSPYIEHLLNPAVHSARGAAWLFEH